MRSVEASPTVLTRLKYGVPPGSAHSEGEAHVDACWYAENMHSVVLARVTEDSVLDRTTCPSRYHKAWRTLHLEVLDVLGGYPVPTKLHTAGIESSHIRVQKGELRLVALRRTEREWYAVKSVQVVEETDPAYATTVTPRRVALPDNVAELRAQFKTVFDRYGDAEVCLYPLRWRADEDFARWLYAPAEYCKPPFVDTVREPPHRAE